MKNQKSQPNNHKAVERLFPALFALRYNREPFPWELRLGEAFVYGELTVANAPRDPGLRAVHHVAEDVKLALTIHRVVADAEQEQEQAPGVS